MSENKVVKIPRCKDCRHYDDGICRERFNIVVAPKNLPCIDFEYRSEAD